jgi:hypothetical protein
VTAEAADRLAAATLEALAAVERGECKPAPCETRALVSLLVDARLIALAVRTAIVHAEARQRPRPIVPGGSC